MWVNIFNIPCPLEHGGNCCILLLGEGYIRNDSDGVLGKHSTSWWFHIYFLCSPRTLGIISNLTSIFFQDGLGWFNHQLVNYKTKKQRFDI